MKKSITAGSALMEACQNSSKIGVMKALSKAHTQRDLAEAFRICVSDVSFEYGAKKIIQSGQIDWSSSEGKDTLKDIVDRFVVHNQDMLGDVLLLLRSRSMFEQQAFPEILMQVLGPHTKAEKTVAEKGEKVFSHPYWEKGHLPRFCVSFVNLCVCPLWMDDSSKDSLKQKQAARDMWQNVKHTLHPYDTIQALLHFSKPTRLETVRKLQESCFALWEESWLQEHRTWWWPEAQRLWNDIPREQQDQINERVPSWSVALERAHLHRKTDSCFDPAPVKTRKM